MCSLLPRDVPGEPLVSAFMRHCSPPCTRSQVDCPERQAGLRLYRLTVAESPGGEKPMADTPVADVHPPYLYPDYKSTRLRAPAQPLVRVAPSPLDTAGPAFPKHFVRDSEADLTTWGKSAPPGEKMVLVGRVLDEDGRALRRSLVE